MSNCTAAPVTAGDCSDTDNTPPVSPLCSPSSSPTKNSRVLRSRRAAKRPASPDSLCDTASAKRRATKAAVLDEHHDGTQELTEEFTASLTSSLSSASSSSLTRSETVAVYEVPGPRDYRVSSTIVELDEDGRAHEKQPVIQKVAVSSMSEALLHRGRKQLPPTCRVAMEAIRLLDNYFCPLTDFNYEPNKPSHQWIRRVATYMYYTPGSVEEYLEAQAANASFRSQRGCDYQSEESDPDSNYNSHDDEAPDPDDQHNNNNNNISRHQYAQDNGQAQVDGTTTTTTTTTRRATLRTRTPSPSNSPQRKQPQRAASPSKNTQLRKTPKELARGLLAPLCLAAAQQIHTDPSLIKMQSPVYVLGDLHGNYKDLQFFSSALWKMGVEMSPANFLFLGDFVDRGPHSVETITYLLALKVSRHNESQTALHASCMCARGSRCSRINAWCLLMVDTASGSSVSIARQSRIGIAKW
jgi:hypothetical protein